MYGYELRRHACTEDSIYEGTHYVIIHMAIHEYIILSYDLNSQPTANTTTVSLNEVGEKVCQ